MTDITVADLTQTTLDGTGVFDTLMRANKVHLEAEFTKGRIKGTEYATVYLGSLESVLRTSMEFLLQRQKISLEAQLMAQQVLLAQAEVTKATAAIALVNAQTANAVAELAILQANALKIPAEIAQLTAQTAHTVKQTSAIDQDILIKQQQVLVSIEEVLVKKQQVLVSTAEVGIAQAKLVNVPKEGLHLDAQTAMVTQQATNLTAEALNIPKQGTVLTNQGAQIAQQTSNLASEALGIVAKTAQTTQQTTNLVAEAMNIPKQGTMLTNQAAQVAQQTLNLAAEKLGIDSKTALTTEQLQTEVLRNFVDTVTPANSGNFEKERQVLIGQKCKLDAEFELLLLEKLKTTSETELLSQKGATERAQVTALGVDDNSVIGKQKALYAAQTAGYARDAEQKATKILIDTWNVRKTTDPDDLALGLPVTNASIEAAVTKLKTGIGA